MAAAPDATPAVRRALEGSASFVLLLAPAGHGKSTALRGMASAEPVAWVDGALPSAVADLRAAAGAVATVLVDDVDRADDPVEAARAIVALVAAGVRVVATSRTRLDLPVRRWQVAGLADVVTARGMVLDRARVGRIVGLRGPALDRAVDVTRGWPSAVALLARRLPDGSLEDAVTASTADHVSFLLDEALDVLTASERRLLSSASVFARIDPRVLQVVVDDDEAERRLRDVVERTQLLVADGDCFTWHPDVRAALARDGPAADPVARRDLHLAASAALGDDLRTAAGRLHHLVEAEAWTEALAVVTDGWPLVVGPRERVVLYKAVDTIPGDLVDHDVVHSLCAGAMQMVTGHPRDAEALFDSAHVRRDASARATSLALRAYGTWWTVPPDHGLDHISEASRLLEAHPGSALLSVPSYESVTSPWGLEISRARALLLSGEVARAAEILAVLPSLTADEVVTKSVSAWATKALTDALAGHVRTATDAVDTSFALAEVGGWWGSAELAPAHLARALVAVRSGSRADVGADVDAAADAATRWSAWGLLRMARAVAAMCGRVERIPTEPDEAGRAVGRFAQQLEGTWTACSRLRAGDPGAAAALLALVEPSELSLGPWVETAMATGDRDAVVACVEALPPPTTPAGTVVRGAVDAALAEPGRRGEVAARAVAEARRHGLAGVLTEAPREVWADLVAVDPGGTVVAPLTARASVAPPLSSRERQVLALLDGPLSVNDIGDELYLSGHTVKWYVARIYRKLGVHNRADAVTRARQLGLL